jgi:hypothetical protein
MTRSTILLLPGAAVAAATGQVLFRLGARDRIGFLDFLNPRRAIRAGEG